MATFGSQGHRSEIPYLSPRGAIFCLPWIGVEKCCAFPKSDSKWMKWFYEFYCLNSLKRDCYGDEAQLKVSFISRESKLTVIGFGIFLSRGLQSTWYFGIGSSPVLHLSNLDFAESVILCLIHIFKTFACATCKPCTTVFDYNFTMQIYPHFCSF